MDISYHGGGLRLRGAMSVGAGLMVALETSSPIHHHCFTPAATFISHQNSGSGEICGPAPFNCVKPVQLPGS
jgi:hypothetical protein